jgi:hypothetical protein
MQGKFKLGKLVIKKVVLYNVGHIMQEDDPLNTAKNFHAMIN